MLRHVEPRQNSFRLHREAHECTLTCTDSKIFLNFAAKERKTESFEVWGLKRALLYSDKKYIIYYKGTVVFYGGLR